MIVASTERTRLMVTPSIRRAADAPGSPRSGRCLSDSGLGHSRSETCSPDASSQGVTLRPAQADRVGRGWPGGLRPGHRRGRGLKREPSRSHGQRRPSRTRSRLPRARSPRRRALPPPSGLSPSPRASAAGPGGSSASIPRTGRVLVLVERGLRMQAVAVEPGARGTPRCVFWAAQ